MYAYYVSETIVGTEHLVKKRKANILDLTLMAYIVKVDKY